VAFTLRALDDEGGSERVETRFDAPEHEHEGDEH
jgi:hypothetical protein